MFDRKSIFYIEKSNIDIDELELTLIDYGLEKIKITEDEIIIYGDYTSFGSINKGLSTINLNVTKSELQRIPNSPINFNEEQLEPIEKMLDKIEDDEDVQYVYTNIS